MTGAGRVRRSLAGLLVIATLAGCGDVSEAFDGGDVWPEDAPTVEDVQTDVADDWAEATREAVREVLLPFEPPAADVVVLASSYVDDGAILREELEFTTFDGLRAFAVILRPVEEGTYPAILAMHPHDVTSDYMTWDSDKCGAGLSLALTRAGFVTMSPDIRSYGRFRPGGLPHWGSDGYANLVRQQGDVFARLAINDARVALGILREWDGVDPARMGMAGLSVGAFITQVTAVVEDDLGAVAISNFLVPFDKVFSDKHHYCQNLSALHEIGEAYELLASVFPRVVQIHWGEDDVFINRDDGIGETGRLEARAAELGFTDSLEVFITPELGHCFDLDAQADFFRRRL